MIYVRGQKWRILERLAPDEVERLKRAIEKACAEQPTFSMFGGVISLGPKQIQVVPQGP